MKARWRIAVWAVAVMSVCCAVPPGAAQEHELARGPGYRLTVTKSAETREQWIGNGAVVLPCGEPAQEFAVPLRNLSLVTVPPGERLLPIANALGLNEEDPERELKNAVVDEVLRRLATAGVLTAAVRKPPSGRSEAIVRPEASQCFDQRAFIKRRVERYRVVHERKGKRSLFFTRDPVYDELSIDRTVDYAVWFELSYREACAPACRIEEKTRPVVDAEGKPLVAAVDGEEKRYLVPLHFSANGGFVDLQRMLPPEVLGAVKASGAAAGLGLSGTILAGQSP